MRVALITNTISRPGGAEYLTIAMYISLREIKDLRIDVLGREKNLDINALNKWIGPKVTHELSKHYVYIREFPLNILKLKDYNLVINTRSNEVLAPAHIHYLHWIFSPYGVKNPDVLAYYKESYGINGRSMRYLARYMLHYVQLKVSRLVLANSRYVANLLKDLGVNATILHPPVRSEEILQYTQSSKWSDRRIVLTITRIAPGKLLETLPVIAAKVKSAKFVLAGSLQDENYYAKLLRLKKALDVDNFTIVPNVSRHELYELLGKALIYLHTAKHEQFGIAVAEAMAAGAIPIVHRSGGPWHDILDGKDGFYGYSYGNIEESIEKIKDIVNNPHRYAEVSERARLRALVFDEQLFKVKFKEIIKNLLGL
jgi:glycosyltransferase involved in cell wall biosynthesis